MTSEQIKELLDLSRRALLMVALESIDAFTELIKASEESRVRRKVDYKRGLKEAYDIIKSQNHVLESLENRFQRGAFFNEYAAKQRILGEVMDLLEKEINK